jgi:protein-tyrosine phosphatase
MSELLPFEWIDTDGRYRLAIMHHPPGGLELDAYIAALHALGVDVLVSMLAADEAEWMELGAEAEVCARHQVQFLSFPIEDHSLPESRADTLAFARGLLELLEAGKSVVIHCYAGIGRSALMAITTLFAAGFDLYHAMQRVSEARGFEVPEANQREWLVGFLSPPPQ